MPANDAMHGEPRSQRDFATTHWTIVLAARGRDQLTSQDALAQLCETYWPPIYAYVRRRLAAKQEAQDFTQAFFAHFLERSLVASANPDRGRFRSFLLTACQRFLINEWYKNQAAKRGGGRRPFSLDFDSAESRMSLVAVDAITPERLFDQQWAISLLDRVLEQLQAEYAARDRLPYFETLKPFLAGESVEGGYATAARTLGISATNAKVAAHRMRRRYRELLRAEIAPTVAGPEEIDDEIRELFAILGRNA